jgi:hypothetical protein
MRFSAVYFASLASVVAAEQTAPAADCPGLELIYGTLLGLTKS